MIVASHESGAPIGRRCLPREIGKLEDTDAALQKLLTNDTDLERPLRDLGLLPRLAVFDLDRHFVVGRFQLQRPDGLGHAPFSELDGAGKLHGDDHAFDLPKVFSEHLSKRIAEYISKK